MANEPLSWSIRLALDYLLLKTLRGLTSICGFGTAKINKIGAAAADTLARAIVHALLSAKSAGDVPAYRDGYPSAFSW